MIAQETRPLCGRRLELRSDLAELDRLSAFAAQIGDEEGLNSDQVFGLQLCLEEAVTNIIMHGGEKSEVQIVVMLLSHAPNLVICIEDEARAFDPTSVAAPATPTSLEDTPIGGMGVHFIRKMSTSMRYEHSGGRNRLFLGFGPRP
jgi:serine/threonine-protein kinase RsbW